MCWRAGSQDGGREGIRMSNSQIMELSGAVEIFLYQIAIATIAETQKFCDSFPIKWFVNAKPWNEFQGVLILFFFFTMIIQSRSRYCSLPTQFLLPPFYSAC